jgi:hypothetical protein
MKTLRDIQEFDTDSLAIWAIHADKIPPHIGISKAGKFYSLKVNGKDDGLNVPQLILTFKKKKVPVLIIQLKEAKYIDLEDVFLKYERASCEGSTCLEPVSSAIGFDKFETVHELLSALNEKEQMKDWYGLNLKSNYSGIPFYTKSSILDHLKKLEQ